MSSSSSAAANRLVILDAAWFTRTVVDMIHFPGGTLVNSSLVTTGPSRFTVGSSALFQLSGFLDKLPWDLTGGSARLLLADPNGQSYDYAATVQNRGAVYDWTVLNVAGTWVRSWKATGADGTVEYSIPITFSVVASPGTPI